MAVVVFNYADWIAQYPEFASVTDPQAQGFFNQACLILNNTDLSVVQDVTERTTLLYLLTAHIAYLAGRAGSGGGVVGTMTQGQQGSTNITTQLTVPGSAQWFAQTQYGYTYYQATIKYRNVRYVAPCPRNFNPWLGPWGR